MTTLRQPADADEGRSQELVRSLRLTDATALVVGTIIGASVFVQASEVTALVPNIPLVLSTWVVSGVLTLFGALVCAELASAFPRTGGVYVFLRETFGPLVGFLWGWSMFWIMHSGIIAVMAVVFARYAAFFVPLDDRGMRVVAVVTILAISGVNYFGVRLGGTLQTVFTAGKLLAVVLVLAIGFILGAHLPAHFQYTAPGGVAPSTHIGVQGFLLALVAGLFTFGGWHIVTYTAEETVLPERTIPLALMVGVAIVTACYVALNTVYFYVLPLDRVAASPRVAADAAVALLGTTGGAAISGLVAFSAFGAMTGTILAAPRVYFAMAKDGLVFRWLGDIHPRFRTPHRAIVLQGLWASVLVWTGTYRQLFSRVIFTEWAFFAAMAAGLFVLRRRPTYRPAYRVWGYPWVPRIFIVAALAIVINRLRSQPLDSVMGLLLVGLGVPVYFAWAARSAPLAYGVDILKVRVVMGADPLSAPPGMRLADVARRDQSRHLVGPTPALALADVDREMVARVRAGDEEAFTHLFRTHHASLCTYASRLVGDAEVARDLVQSGMLRVWQHRARWELRPGGTVRAYLYAVVRNVALQHLHHERCVHRICDGSVARGDAIAMGQGAGNADDLLATRDLETALSEALETLPPRCREAFMLRRAVGLPIAEIARVMGIAPKTVEVQIGAALRALREQLRDWTGWPTKQASPHPGAPALTKV